MVEKYAFVTLFVTLTLIKGNMATIRKRGKKWQVQVRLSDRPSQSRSFEKYSEARSWARSQEGSVSKKTKTMMASSTTISELIDRYMTDVLPMKRGAMVEKYRLIALCRHPISTKKLSSLSIQDFIGFRDSRLRVIKPVTLKRELAILAHVFQYAETSLEMSTPAGLLKSMRVPDYISERDRRLRNGEEARLVQAAANVSPTFLLPLITLAIDTAMRRGELFGLTWSDISFERNEIRIRSPKNGKPRTVWFGEKSQKALLGLSDNTQPFIASLSTFKRKWKTITTEADCLDLRFHDLRHEAISRLYERGLQTAQVMHISGHSDHRMLMRYTHLTMNP